VIIDPLAMPVGAVRYAGQSLFKIVRRCRDELGVNNICGASNISFGLPGRPQLNAAFMAMAVAAGMTCAITNPIEAEIKTMILAADVMLGHDENCANWLKFVREAQAKQAAAAPGAAPPAGTPGEGRDVSAERAAREARRAARRGQP
jgi:5-methyltetrahydrofolate--homocysteine methyltransferase